MLPSLSESVLHSKRQNTQDNSYPGLIERLQSELAVLKEQASEEAWDGEGGAPVSSKVFEVASQFLKVMPPDRLERTEIEGSGFGEVVFSWDSDDRKRSLVVAIQPSDSIAISGVIDEIKIHGYVSLEKDAKSRLGDLVNWVF